MLGLLAIGVASPATNAGELKWQGAKGEEIARDWIDRLLAE